MWAIDNADCSWLRVANATTLEAIHRIAGVFWDFPFLVYTQCPVSICHGLVERGVASPYAKAIGQMSEPALFFSIHIEPDFLLPIWDGDVALC